MSSNPSPVSFSHIGITVPDLDKAVEFYTKALGLYLIMPSTTINHDESAIGVMCDDVFGEGWGSFRIAHLSTNDGIGVELFEFPKTEDERAPFEYWRPRLFHFCVQDPDLEGRVKLIEQHGGKQRADHDLVVRHTGGMCREPVRPAMVPNCPGGGRRPESDRWCGRHASVAGKNVWSVGFMRPEALDRPRDRARTAS